MRRKTILGAGVLLFVAAFLVVDAALMRARLFRVEIEAPGTVFHFPHGAEPRTDRLDLRIDIGDETLFEGPPPVDRESIDAWLAMTWPGAECVIVCDDSAVLANELTGHVVRFLVDDDTIPSAHGLLIAVSESGGSVRGTVLMVTGPDYRSSRSNRGPATFSKRISEHIYLEYREWRERPSDDLDGLPPCGSTSGVGMTIAVERARSLLERVAALVRGFPEERVRSIAAAIEAMESPADRTWCLLTGYRGEEAPLIVHARREGSTVQLIFTSTCSPLPAAIQPLFSE